MLKSDDIKINMLSNTDIFFLNSILNKKRLENILSIEYISNGGKNELNIDIII